MSLRVRAGREIGIHGAARWLEAMHPLGAKPSDRGCYGTNDSKYSCNCVTNSHTRPLAKAEFCE
jgi:hypothetical protein